MLQASIRAAAGGDEVVPSHVRDRTERSVPSYAVVEHSATAVDPTLPVAVVEGQAVVGLISVHYPDSPILYTATQQIQI